MDVENNAPAEAVENQDTLSMIAELRGAEKPAETGEISVSEGNAAEKPSEPLTQEAVIVGDKPAEPASEDLEKEAEARRTALLREIAMDPVATQQYAQQQYYAPQQVTHTPPITAPESQAPALPFDEFSFDPSNPQHQQALFDARLQEVGGPLFQKIDAIAERFAREDALQQQQYVQQVANHANQKTVEFIDTYVPGFAGIAQKVGKGDELSVQEEAVFNLAVNMESSYLQQYPGAVYDLQARAQIAQAIGPILKEKAKALGLVAQPSKQPLTAEQKQVMRQESYVESSNAVPANTAGKFEKALKSRDTLGMIHELRQSRS